MTKSKALWTSEGDINAPLLYKGKVRELYDLGDEYLFVVTDRLSAHDHIFQPPIPQKGSVLNRLSQFWFGRTGHLRDNHFIHADVEKLVENGVLDASKSDLYRDRVTVGRKAERIDIECVVRGHLTGGGWRQYKKNGAVCGIMLTDGMRKNQKLSEPLFTPASKNDVGHDEDISFEETVNRVGRSTAEELREASILLYEYARGFCEEKGVILADCKLEFGRIDGELVLIDECFTPDSSRFWAKEHFELDVEIDSMDKEPVRQFLLAEEALTGQMPEVLPPDVVKATTQRYLTIFRRITGQKTPANFSDNG